MDFLSQITVRRIFLLVFSFLTLNSFGQDQGMLRSDSINISLVGKYMLIAFGVGIDFPIKQSSVTVQVGFSGTPNSHLDFSKEKVASIEYKHYSATERPNDQFYFGIYSIYKRIDHPGPHESTYKGNWTESKNIGIGPLYGMKWYKGKKIYLEGFLGAHVGWRWGEKRMDDINSIPVESYYTADEFMYGIRFGFLVGFHPIKK